MNQRIPEPIRPTLQDYISLVNQQIPGLMKGFYVEGSIALGEFNEHFSDIDFVALLNRPLTSTEFSTLRHIHKVIGNSYPRWKMSGSYLQSDDLGSCNNLVEANICYEGRLRLEGHFDWNWVAGWILKNHGIAIIGPEPQALPVTIDWDRLIKRMRENLNSYWAGWTRRPDAIGEMMFDLGIQWAVLGVLRQFYSFRENAITTKTKAGEYALTCVPRRWHRLIQEAIDIRAGRRSSAYRFRIVRTKASAYQLRIVRTMEAVRFLKFIIQTCNACFT
jgi:Domain of unknown function (DUF4111)/Nucleotidyltransferase domain